MLLFFCINLSKSVNYIFNYNEAITVRMKAISSEFASLYFLNGGGINHVDDTLESIYGSYVKVWDIFGCISHVPRCQNIIEPVSMLYVDSMHHFKWLVRSAIKKHSVAIFPMLFISDNIIADTIFFFLLRIQTYLFFCASLLSDLFILTFLTTIFNNIFRYIHTPICKYHYYIW